MSLPEKDEDRKTDNPMDIIIVSTNGICLNNKHLDHDYHLVYVYTMHVRALFRWFPRSTKSMMKILLDFCNADKILSVFELLLNVLCRKSIV